jgi:hypothetical protein
MEKRLGVRVEHLDPNSTSLGGVGQLRDERALVRLLIQGIEDGACPPLNPAQIGRRLAQTIKDAGFVCHGSTELANDLTQSIGKGNGRHWLSTTPLNAEEKQGMSQSLLSQLEMKRISLHHPTHHPRLQRTIAPEQLSEIAGVLYYQNKAVIHHHAQRLLTGDHSTKRFINQFHGYCAERNLVIEAQSKGAGHDPGILTPPVEQQLKQAFAFAENGNMSAFKKIVEGFHYAYRPIGSQRSTESPDEHLKNIRAQLSQKILTSDNTPTKDLARQERIERLAERSALVTSLNQRRR